MLIIISGPTGVGKSFCLERFCARGFHTIIPFTTRPPRPSESEGVHYYFRSDSELRELSGNFANGYWARPLGDGHHYGYPGEVDTLCDTADKYIIQACSEIALDVKARNPRAHLIFLDYSTDAAMAKRIRERFGPAEQVLDARLKHATRERQCKHKYDLALESDNPEDLARKLSDVITSQMIARRAPLAAGASGLLTDRDILASFDSPTALVYGGDTEAIKKRIHGWSVDLTLAKRYYRVRSPRIFRRVFDLADGHQAEMVKRFKECFAEDNQPILLRRNEFILGFTSEKVLIPNDTICLLSGRTSYARLGISVDFSQNILQPGHDAPIPLQIKNNLPYPIVIYPHIRVAQAGFMRMSSPVATPYSRYSAAKYSHELDDHRTRYYDDDVYKTIRAKRTVRSRVDWDYTLNVLLALFGWFVVAAFGLELVPALEAWRHFAGLIKVYSLLIAIPIATVRTIRFFISK